MMCNIIEVMGGVCGIISTMMTAPYPLDKAYKGGVVTAWLIFSHGAYGLFTKYRAEEFSSSDMVNSVLERLYHSKEKRREGLLSIFTDTKVLHSDIAGIIADYVPEPVFSLK